jgi:hypothetical protein
VFSSCAHLLTELFILVFNFLSSLYILDINPLSDECLTNIPFFVGCVFTVLMGSFAVLKLFNLMQSHLSVLSLIS